MISVEDYNFIVQEAAHDLSQNACYPSLLREEFRNFNVIYQIDDHGFEKMAALFAMLSSTGNAEKFSTGYFGTVPLYAD